MSDWPDKVPPLTGPEAIRAVKRLYRFAMKKTWEGPVVLTSGRRHTWVRRGTFYVNPASWQYLVYDLSWYFYRREAPILKRATAPKIQAKLIREVVDRGWLTDGLKVRELEPVDQAILKEIERENKLRKQLESGVKRWTTKLTRAQTMLTKYERKLKRYHAATRRAGL